MFVPPRAVPKTSSGKLRRGACRDLYLRGELGVERSIKRQLLTLGARTVVPLARRAAARIKTLSYAGWFWFCFVSATFAACLLANLMSGRAAWRAVAGVARGFFAVVGIPVRVHGRENLPPGPSVLVFNHASNLDAIALLTMLPAGVSIVAKSELGRNRLARRGLGRLGVLFVERFDGRRAVEDAARLEAKVRGGGALVVFPEGTNRRIPGLFPFHLGAFLIAARTGAPLVPARSRGHAPCCAPTKRSRAVRRSR